MERELNVAVPDDLPRVSVIVAIYNAQRTLEACLDSLLALDYPKNRVEVVCVDNGSSDRTPQILARYQQAVRVLREPTRGAAAARNRGLRQAAGDVVAFTDADCVVDRDWLRSIVVPLGDPHVGAVGGKILSKRPCNAIERFGERIHDHERAIREFMPPYAIAMNWSSRLSVLREMSFFNETLLRGQDVDLSYRLLQAGYTLAYEPRAVVYHANERTPWGLAHEGYVHGYHAVNVRKLHAVFLREARAARPERARPDAMATDGRAAEKWRDVLLWQLFRAGKALGRVHASLTHAVRAVSDRAV